MASGRSLPSRTSASCDWSGTSDRLSSFTGCRKPFVPSRLQADRLELPLDVLDRLVEARRADVAAFELVVGQKLDVRPPLVPFGGEVRAGRLSGGSSDDGTGDQKR